MADLSPASPDRTTPLATLLPLARQFGRFLAVGLINTAVGYSVVLAGLHLGLGDYLANCAGYAAGLPVAYLLQRRWVFAVASRRTPREIVRFGLTAAIAFAVNLGVIHLARSLGYVDNPIAQAAAMVAYSVTFFLLSRFVVFAGRA